MRGANRFEGYYKDPEKNAETIDGAGWLHTGDIGAMDRDGYLSYQGRSSDMLKVGGENVAPAEIESQLSTHPGVHLVAVVGVPDPVLGEVPAAFVELAAGHGDTSGEQLVEHCRAAIARFKIPRYVRFVAEWPMSATKIQRGRLREQLIEELENPPVS